MAAEPLYDYESSDLYGIEEKLVAERVNTFSKDFERALFSKSIDLTSNLLFGYGNSVRAPRVMRQAVESVEKVVIAWAVEAGFVTLNEAAVAPPKAEEEEAEGEVVQLKEAHRRDDDVVARSFI
jgi:RNA-splicing ligase RtcB